jgi:hypothetical protein
MSTRIRVQFWLVLFGLTILTCPGSANDERERSRFAGTYSGKYIFMAPNLDEPQEGVITSSIDDKGNITGEGTNTTQNQTAKHTGTIDEDGRVKLVIEFPNATFTCVGTASKTRKGTIIATLTQKSGMKAMGVVELEVAPKK